MLSNEELISMIFYIAGGEVKSLTKLKKVLSLLKCELELECFGDESWVEEVLDELELRGLLEFYKGETDIIYEFFGESPVRHYVATKELIKAGERAYRKLFMTNPIKAMYIMRLVRATLSVDLTYLIAYLYYKWIAK